ncbi:lytic transglycosylase domain-containing protein [Tenacibaculum maritimum]|uniref:lytic transglycosylase domain-containing protein n=1 Tax=Tenacibaculum maritimum TaxID=107401 RepID=UPI003875E01A
MSKTLARLLLLVSFLAIAFLFTNAMGISNIQLIKNVSDKYEIRAVKIPTYLELAGERVPIERANIKERIDRELLVNTYWQSNGLLMIKRSYKYFPIIEPLLAKYGLPDDFKYLCVAESGLQNNRSPAGAAGFWHFLKQTGREYGLEVNKNVDERYHLEKATKVAAAYLKRAKEKFGSWTLAAAAYNAGSGRISQRLKEQKVNDYYDLLLNDETSRYVFRILALKEILTNPEKYGFVYDQEDLYRPTKTYTVKIDTAITDIASFANKFGVTYKQIKLVNPWLRETKLNNKSRKVYQIKIPII